MRRVALLLIICCRALACECSLIGACDLVDSPVMFIGEVIDGGISSLTDDPWHMHTNRARFKVLERFRGIPAGTTTVDVQLLVIGGMCSPVPYYAGKTYLVVPSPHDGILSDGPCFSGRDVQKYADDVRYLRDYFGHKAPTNIHGLVGSGDDSDSIEYSLQVGEAKPLAGVQVTARQGGVTYSATTDSSGRYYLSIPRPGSYSVTAQLLSYESKSEEDITLAKGNCQVQNFALSTDNTISGKLWDDRGQPVNSVMVGLIDVNQAISRFDRHVWFAQAYSGESRKRDGTFSFSGVPLGSYLLVANADGPRNGRLFDVPYERTYYPLGSTRANAKVIEIGSNHIHLTGMDLVIGPPVALRKVVVDVHFPDGSPMKTAYVECSGELDGDIIWYQTGGGRKASECMAPVNRKLHIVVKDQYRRDLGGDYSATFEPGTTAITKEFVIRP